MSAAILTRRRLPESGEMVSVYEVVAPVAQGGMAEVFLVRRRGLGGFERRLAMKVMHPHLGGDASFVNMFLDEARIASCVDHPNVVKVLDVGSHDGLPWLVMEWLDGKSLADVLMHPTRLSIALRANVLAEIATGLHAAHEARGADGAPLGVVHRDVSPQNVHVGYDGVVKLVDFGIAAARGRLTRTETGQVKGKVGYLAPEQLLHPSDAVDRRVDVWAFGVMAWETLAIRRLFGGTDPGTKMYQIVHAAVPALAEVAPDVPEEIASLVMQCLERDPEKRPAAMSEIARTLKRVASDPHAREAIATHMTTCFEDERRSLEAQFDSLRAGSTPSRTPSGEVPKGSRPADSEEISTRVDVAAALARHALEEKASQSPAEALPASTPSAALGAPEELEPARPPRSTVRWTWPLALVLALALGGIGAMQLSGLGAAPTAPDDEPPRIEAPPAGASALVEVAPPTPTPTPAPSLAPTPPVSPAEPRPSIIELRLGRGVTAVHVGGVEHEERPLRIELDEEGTAEVVLRGQGGRRVTRTLDASDDGSTLELAPRRRDDGPLWGSPY